MHVIEKCRVPGRPCAQQRDRLVKALSVTRETVFRLGWDQLEDLALDEAVLFKGTKDLAQHFLRDVGDLALHLAEAPDAT